MAFLRRPLHRKLYHETVYGVKCGFVFSLSLGDDVNMRVQKYLSERKIMSRREAERAMIAGFVFVNGGAVMDLGRQIDPAKDKIEVRGNSADKNFKITVVYNKPRGIVASKSKREGETIFDRLPQFSNLNCVGRLDKESDGLILLSNDGVVTSIVTGDSHRIEKEYIVETREMLKPRHMNIMERGMELDGGRTLPAKTELLSAHSFGIILREGKHHQIRRMCAALNLTVANLTRIRVGNIMLQGISEGDYRVLSASEIGKLKELAR